MKTLVLFIMGGTLLLAGCQTTADSPASATADQILTQAVPTNYRQLIVQYLHGKLKDPYSVRSAEISQPAMGWVGLLNGGQMPVVCTRFNSKNSFGAYTGIKPVAVIFQGSRAVNALPDFPLACENRTYSPFPELEKGA